MKQVYELVIKRGRRNIEIEKIRVPNILYAQGYGEELMEDDIRITGVMITEELTGITRILNR